MPEAQLKISELLRLGCYGVKRTADRKLCFNAWADAGSPITEDDVRASSSSIPALKPYGGCNYLADVKQMRTEHIYRVRWLMLHPASWDPIHFEINECGVPELVDGHHTLAAAAMLKQSLIAFRYSIWSSTYRFQFAASYASGLFRARV